MQRSSSLYSTLKFLLLSLLCALGLETTQAEISVNAGLSQNQAAVGDQVQLSIQIRGATQLPSQPELELPDLDIQPTGGSQMTQIENGQVQIFATYTYLVSAEKAGDFEIPVLDVTIEGKIYKTQALKLKITEAPVQATPANDPFRPILKLETGKTDIYEGEVVPLTITMLIHQGVNLRELPFPTLPRENFAMKRFQRNPDQNMVQMNGALYRAFYFRTSVSAIKSGDLILGPAEVKIDLEVPDGSGRRDPFGFMNAKVNKYKLKSDPLAIKVKPLPEAGKPANFSGAVGKFTTQIQAQPLKLMQGDPIAATLYINGVGNFESLEAPTIESTTGWRLYAAKQVQENRSTGLEPGTVVYSQVLIPDQVQTQIPSFSLTFFNPDTAKYEVARTDAIPLQVVPNPNAPGTSTAAALPSTGIRDFSFSDKDVPKEELNGILTVLRQPGTLSPVQASVFTLRHPWLVHGIGAGLLVFILGAAWVRQRGARQTTRQVAAAAPPKASELLRKLRAEHSNLRQFYALAADFLTAWEREGHAPPSTDSAPAEAAKRIRLRRDFYNYGTAEAAAQPVPASEHQEIVDALKNF